MDNNKYIGEERVILNVGGKRFETYRSTLTGSAFTGSLLETMFNQRNSHLLKPNEKGEFFFDRSSEMFEFILNAYRTGSIEIPRSISYRIFVKELDFFQLPHHSPQCTHYNNNNINNNNNTNNNNNNNSNDMKLNLNNLNSNEKKTNISPRIFNNNCNNCNNNENCSISPRIMNNHDIINNNNSNNSINSNSNNPIDNLNIINNNNRSNNQNNSNNNNQESICFCNNNILSGEKLKILSLEKARRQGGNMLEMIKSYCYDVLLKAAEKGHQYEIIQFKSSDNEEFYSFVSNLRNRELLLHDFMNDNFDVYFSEEFGVSHHSYLFQVTFWTRYSTFDMSSTDQVLNEIKQKIIQLSAFIYKKAE